MGLQMVWKSVTIHVVVLEWLRAERKKIRVDLLMRVGKTAEDFARLLDSPDLCNFDENRHRLRFLYGIRNLYVLEIPPDTEWYEVSNLNHEHTKRLYAVNNQAWNDTGDKNELYKVAARKRLAMEKPTSQWERPILWGHDRDGPFTIIEGNHRLAAYAFSGLTDLNISVLVGISPMKCYHHPPDQSEALIYDMFVKPGALM